MKFSRSVTKWTMGKQQITIVILSYMLMQGLVRSEYTVNVASQFTWVNPGDNYVAYCNIPGQGALDIISNLKVRWFHNGQALTSLCEFLSTELGQKYECRVLSPQQNNISLELTVKNVQKADVGNLTSEVYEKIKKHDKWVRDELVDMKSVAIKVREPIKSMVFKFDPSSENYLTQYNNETPHRMEVLPGMYAPSCQVMGSKPPANVRIMMGNQMMQGRIVDMGDKIGRQFVAEKTDFRGNNQVNMICSADVDGLPNSKMQRNYQILIKQRDLKFKCTNSSAIVNNKRHKIICEVYDVEGISCNKIMWKRGDTGDYYTPGSYNNINIACRIVSNSKIETTLEILQVTAEYFKTTFSVIFNDPLSQTKEYQLRIPEGQFTSSRNKAIEYCNSAVAQQAFLVLLISIVLAVKTCFTHTL